MVQLPHYKTAFTFYNSFARHFTAVSVMTSVDARFGLHHQVVHMNKGHAANWKRKEHNRRGKPVLNDAAHTELLKSNGRDKSRDNCGYWRQHDEKSSFAAVANPHNLKPLLWIGYKAGNAT